MVHKLKHTVVNFSSKDLEIGGFARCNGKSSADISTFSSARTIRFG